MHTQLTRKLIEGYSFARIKGLYIIILTSLFGCFLVINMHSNLYRNGKVDIYSKAKIKFHKSTSISKHRNSNKVIIKYILLWTDPNDFPFIYFGEGSAIFINRSCSWTNCYVTGNRHLLGDYTEFDVIAFNGPQMWTYYNNFELPKRRNIKQKYVYANIEAAANYPICGKAWNEFFNWTWTYKLNSDSLWGYMAIRDAKNKIIGPSDTIRWMNEKDMDPIDNDLKLTLKSKHKAAAWFSSNCMTQSKREDFVQKTQIYLKKYNLRVDIYGDCGESDCPRDIMGRCLNMIQRDYYFYFAFENAISEDYVTEKVMYALNHNAVPVVLGGANYSKFMPNGIYLNALELGPENLAKQMNYMIRNKTAYYEFFKWKKYYSYHFRHESPITDDYCNFCEMMNNDALITSYSVYDNISSWWTDQNICVAKYE